MKQSIRLASIGLGYGLLGWPFWILAIESLDALPTNARPPFIEAVVSGVALLLPSMIYLAWRFDNHGAKGLGWVVPIVLFIGLLLLLGPLVPRG